MNSARYITAILICGLFCAACLADVPSTPPTTQPTVTTTRPTRARKPAPKGWVKIENNSNHFFYFVPPKWKIDTRSDAQTNFTIPDKQGQPDGNVDIACTACHQETLDEAVAEQRKTLKADTKHKLVRDETSHLGDRPAWMFVTEQVQQITGYGPKGPIKINYVSRQVSLIAVDGAMHYFVDMFTPGTDYTKNIAFTQAVTDSMEWTNPPATQP